VPTPIRPIPPIRPTPILTLEQRVQLHLQSILSFTSGQPNAEPLWDAIRIAASNYLMTLFRDGTLKGTKPEQAYFVECGRGTTMTELDIEEGRAILMAGFAPNEPAEFDVIHLVLQTATQP
jgi:uncharacterized protein